MINPYLTSKLESKIVDGPVGCIGSYSHLVTNDKILDKRGLDKTLLKEGAKDTLKLGVAVGVTAGAGALVTGLSSKAKGSFQSLISKTGDILSKVSISDKGNLKEIIKNTKVFTKMNSLPAPAKAAILAGGTVLAAGLSVLGSVSSAKAGYYEAKFEE